MARKRINPVYIVGVLILILMLYINKNYFHQSVSFYGFAENKETEINLDYAVEVNTIHVKPGQRVEKGTVLLEVTQPQLNQQLSSVGWEIEAMLIRQQAMRADTRAKIAQLEALKTVRQNEIKSEIALLEAKIRMNQSLAKEMKSIQLPERGEVSIAESPESVRIAALKQELELKTQPIDLELKALKNSIKTHDSSYKTAISKLEKERDFYTAETNKLVIHAPIDGVVGSIQCKAGEYISAFNTLITFYEQTPTLVKGYVHESMLVHVAEGDTVNVMSATHNDNVCKGKVIGLGTRIIEIPGRLRKLPELKTFGREVLIEVPSNNTFLQKEKVVLTIENFKNPTRSFLMTLLN